MREILKRVYFRSVDLEGCRTLEPSRNREAVEGPLLGSLVDTRGLSRQSVDADGVEASFVTFEARPHAKGPGVLLFRERHEPHPAWIICENPTGESVLLPAGTIVTGGWQNRYISETRAMLPGKQEIPVLCVERGRFEGAREFFGHSVLPAILRNRLSGLVDQLDVWDDIMENLVLSGSPSNTLSPVAFADEGPSAELPDSFFGGYCMNDAAGISSFRFSQANQGRQLAKELQVEIHYWTRLKRHARMAREYFRVFDEKLRVAVRCSADGKAIKGIDGKYFVFRYSPEDLANSFTPPIEEPPHEDLSFPTDEHFASADDWLSALKDARMKPLGVAGDIRFFSLHHADFGLTGRLAIQQDEAVFIDATTFRAYAI